ncbi:MAG: TonB-dependent receptor, partial [Rhizorhabdus sp.]|nr:TonB-dependent receptor [Rhizorhabdus sp.]
MPLARATPCKLIKGEIMPSHIAKLLPLSMLILSSAAFADEIDQGTIVVTATRSEQPLSKIGQTITVIDQQQIATRQTETVADLLRTVPGVLVIRNGGIGNTTSVFIRGAEREHTVALIDGIKL